MPYWYPQGGGQGGCSRPYNTEAGPTAECCLAPNVHSSELDGGKEPVCQCRRLQRCGFPSLGWEDPLEEGRAAHSRILAWRIRCTEEPGGLQATGSQRDGHNWSDLACTRALSWRIPASETREKRQILGSWFIPGLVSLNISLRCLFFSKT